MSTEELWTETYTPPVQQRRLRIETDQQGVRHLILGMATIATEGDDQWAAMAKHVAAFPARPDSVAWIGGGFCLGPRIARGRARAQTVYELRPQLERFCPNYATFVAGDWQQTLTGTFDVIVYDLDVMTENDRTRLQTHLNPGGLLLGGE